MHCTHHRGRRDRHYINFNVVPFLLQEASKFLMPIHEEEEIIFSLEDCHDKIKR